MRKLKKNLKKIKLLALDFDGVLTDGKVYVDRYGNETVCCSRKDGQGIEMLRDIGILTIVISKESNPVVKKRCEKLNIICYQGKRIGDNKLKILKEYAIRKCISKTEILYIGDDTPDIPCMKFSGIPVTVADGHPDCKSIASIILSHKGGDHAVRELCDMLIASKAD